MDVIRHHDERVQFDRREPARQSIPFRQNHPSRIVQLHLATDHVAEQTRPILGADGDEIRPHLRIIVILQTDGPAMVFL